MDLPVPAHIRPLRDEVLAFVTQRVFPLEPVLNAGLHGDAKAAEALRGLQEHAKSAGLWALGHPRAVGGGGLPFMDYVYINEVIGMS